MRRLAVSRADRQGQGGFVLAAALVALLLSSLVIAALLALVGAGTTATAALRAKAERARTADSALEQAVTRVARNYTGARDAGGYVPALDSGAASLGKLPTTTDPNPCPTFTLRLNPINAAAGDNVRVECRPLFTFNNGRLPGQSTHCGDYGNLVNGVCREGTSPGLARRVELTVSVKDRSGLFRVAGVARVRIIDVNPATGLRSNGYSTTVEKWDLCSAEASVSACATAPAP